MSELSIDPDARAGRWRSWILPVVLLTLLVALAATVVVLVRDRRETPAAISALAPADRGSVIAGSSPAEQAVARARVAARSYFTLDFRSVAADMDRFRELGTPAFVEEYDQMAQALMRRVRSQRLQLSASLPADGVATEYLTEGTAQLMVSVDVTTRRAESSSRTAYRTRVLLERVDDQWLVAAVDEVA